MIRTGAFAGFGALLLAACAGDDAARYRAYEEQLIFDGGLREDAAPVDAPFTNAALASNFERIALNREYRRAGDGLLQETTPTNVSRWTDPIRYRLFGGGATPQDHADYAALAARLAALTGLDVHEAAPGEREPNVSILILGADERRAFIHALERDGTAKRMPLVIAWADDISYPCIGQVGYRDPESGRITGAMIMIKAELQGALRLSCIHEELSQTLGLLNDDPRARPSIFNDDQEFATLTEHDELLLRILYDPRMKPGMTAEEALPIVNRIIDEMRPEDSDAPVPQAAGG